MQRANETSASTLVRAIQNGFECGRRWDEASWPPGREDWNGRNKYLMRGEESWRWVATFCSARGLAALGASCVALYRTSRSIVPGLVENGRPYPHQVNGVCFMLRRERSGCGGIMADAPGLGKTLVCLCVMLRTAGMVGDRSVLRSAAAEAERRRRQEAVPGLRSLRDAKGEVSAAFVGGTLLVVPATLIGHWVREMGTWCQLQALGWVFIEGAQVLGPWTRAKQLGLPSAWGGPPGRAPDVAVVSDARLAAEFGDERDARYFGQASYRSPISATAWLRVIVDEGHHQGSIDGVTNVALMLQSLAARRKWIMSGTPLTQRRERTLDGAFKALRQLGKLLECAGVIANEHVWRTEVLEPLLHGGRSRLGDYCRMGLIRHTTTDLRLPTPRKLVTRLAMSDAEINSLNAFVSFILSNLLLTSMEVDDQHSMRDGHEVSLLNPKNRRQAVDAIRNILLCCAGGGEMVPHAPPGTLEELVFLLSSVHGAPAKAVSRVQQFIEAASRGGNQSHPCESCGLVLSYLLITPCCHLVCPECVEPHHKACVACGQPFRDVEFFVSDDKSQHAVEVVPRLQQSGGARIVPPRQGADLDLFEIRCRHWFGWATRNDASARRCDKQHVAWKTKTMSGVDAFVWLQPGLELRWREAMLETEADSRALALWRRRRQFRDDSATQQNVDAASLSTIKRDDTIEKHSKALHVVRRLEAALEARHVALASANADADTRPVRCIVFAEERRVLDWVGHFLVLRFGEDAVQQFWGRVRADELLKFERGIAVGWRCPKCSFLNEDSTAKTCAKRFVHVRAAAGRRLRVAETRVENYYVGRVFRVGEPVVVPDDDAHAAPIPAVVDVVKRCGVKKDFNMIERRMLPEDQLRVLLLHRDGRHGLSLPATTHIFLINTIWEKSVEQQVVARAARIGACLVACFVGR